MTPHNVALTGTAKTVASLACLAGFAVVSIENELGVGVAGRRRAPRGLVEFRAIWPIGSEGPYVHVWHVGWHEWIIGPVALKAELSALVAPCEP